MTTRRDPDRTRETILATAIHEFAGKGLSGGRVDRIARRAGVNKRMIYHYFGSKDRLYVAALERVYEGRRGVERQLNLDHLAPEAALRDLIEFNFDYLRAHPEVINMIAGENLHRGRHLKKSKKVRQLHSPLVQLLENILKRGAAKGVFRRGIDPVDLYISIAALGFFYLGNRWTLSTIFGRDLDNEAAFRRRKAHNVEMIMAAVAPGAARVRPRLVA